MIKIDFVSQAEEEIKVGCDQEFREIRMREDADKISKSTVFSTE